MNGKPLKEYIAARDAYGVAELIAQELDGLERGRAELRRTMRATRIQFRVRIDELLVATMNANTTLRAVAEGLLYTIGYHKHHRGEWRMKRELATLTGILEGLKAEQKRRSPLVKYDAPCNDSEAIEVFAKARAGDRDAQDRVYALIRSRKWVDWIGDLGRQATWQLSQRVAGGDSVFVAGIFEKCNAMRRELLGDQPTVLEELLVRRVVNSWVTTHGLELELAVRPPSDSRSREYLERALTRAQKRLTEAIGELARVRHLQSPRLIGQLNVAAAQTVVNGIGVTDP